MKWIGLGAAVGMAATMVVLMIRKKRRSTRYDVGHISEAWIVRHRSVTDDPWT